MNRGVLETSPVQQLMTAGNPNWWSMNGGMRPPTPPMMAHHQLPPPPQMSPLFQPPLSSLPALFPQFLPSPTSSSSSSSPSWLDNQELPPESWSLSQLLLGGLMVGDEEKLGMTLQNFQAKKLENWEEQVLSHHRHQHQHHNHHPQGSSLSSASPVVDVKQENCGNNIGYSMYGSHHHNHHQVMPNSPPNKSCVTTSTLSSSNSMLDFSSSLSNGNTSSKKADGRHPPPDRSSECNSAETGGSVKKPRVQPSPCTQSTLKVRKEKLGGRIAALHQLVSPFGKTDTASVLSEAIGYIRFLQSQIEALSLPYFGTASENMRQQQHVQGERHCVFTQDSDQVMNDKCMERKGGSVENHQNPNEEPVRDLRSRGLCLVPISCTLQVSSENGAYYWAPALGPTGFQ